MSDEESLSPASRLNSDSATSPVCAASATAAPIVTSCRLPSCMATRSSTSGPYNSAAASAPTVPPIAPAHVFLGVSAGASVASAGSTNAACAEVPGSNAAAKLLQASAGVSSNKALEPHATNQFDAHEAKAGFWDAR